MLEKSVVEQCWKRVLEKSVSEAFCRKEVCREVLLKRVVGKCWRRVL